MTERLYDNSKLTTFEATVTSCSPAGKYYELTLDRSAFFPEGGGQKGDVGLIDSVKVLDTYEKNGEVVHKCTAPIEAGMQVCGEVDADIRLRRMQNHSGEHLLMGVIHRKTGFENVGFHLGSDDVTLDLDGVIPTETLIECEFLANKAIAADLPVTISYPDSESLKTLEYRSKLEMTENVRIVTIEGVDVCACCAPHVASTGQIGIIKVLSAESYKGGTRLHILCGLDAFELIRNRMDELSAISRLLSAKPEKILEQTKRLIDENDALKRQLADIEQRKAARIISSLSNSTRGSFCVFTEGLNTASMRDIANEAVKLTDGAAGIFCQNENGWNYIIASDSLPLRSMSAQINSALNGKGGGSDKMLQGSCMAERTAIEDVIKKLH
ncbi:alanyl-tRNA editing protein [Ruminococcus albus]|uniref:Threonine/alanine tRNA ligase second additional domain protein n=1 Tax=Ruminococcus albus 8 TaxID=246199 RepID=E9SC35_RUMAL|nr:alanine--tRNA ligase-related protein [Ruminococcus albus]EGC03196.1 threonine/alanine tRNA ligase second additional domain protein [Ruminococcus albus 8]MCC3351955.1 alanyl-tRNA editing protein [Ruminococcus albus 8]